jgi:hypothetical protein
MNGVWVGQLEEDLNKRLPDGSTWEQAEAWFASHDLKPSGIYDDNHNRKIGMWDCMPNDSFLSRAQIVIEVYFSPEGRLNKRLIRRRVPSL